MTEGKNLIYLVMDSVRPDYLNCYGRDDVMTTEIDRLADGGVLFEDVVSAAPWTVPSVNTHATGVHPHELQIYNPDVTLDEVSETVFERFDREGYRTGIFFDSERRRQQFENGVDHYGWSYDIEDVLDFISEGADDGFFLFNLYRGTHLPYVLKYSKESWYRAKDEAMEKIRHGGEGGIQEMQYRYQNAIENFSEWYLRAIIDRLEDEGIRDETAIVLTSDHGESWSQRFDDQEDVTLFDLHGPLLYNEVLKVPLIMDNLGTAEGLRVDEMVRSVDVLPTVLDALDIGDGGSSLDGVSLAPALEGRPDEVTYPEYAISSTTSYESPEASDLSVISKLSVIRDDWKLIMTPSEDGREELELYDLDEDPGEEHDLSDEREDRVADLREILNAEVEGSLEKSDEEVGGVRDRLEDLGYL